MITEKRVERVDNYFDAAGYAAQYMKEHNLKPGACCKIEREGEGFSFSILNSGGNRIAKRHVDVKYKDAGNGSKDRDSCINFQVTRNQSGNFKALL